MAYPKYNITANSGDSHQTSPSWCVAFVRYANPAATFTDKNSNLATKPLLVIQDDALSITVSNSKHDFLKSCEIMLKSGDVYYPNAVAPGDWAVIWIHEYKEKTEEIIAALNKINPKSTGDTSILNNWDSGLKFIGRVTNIGAHDTVSSEGVRSLTQRIEVQAFAELTNTIYFTYMATAQLKSTGASGQFIGSDAFKSGAIINNAVTKAGRFQDTAFPDAWKRLITAGLQSDKRGLSPSDILTFLIVWFMGFEPKDIKLVANNKIPLVPTSFGQAIVVPPDLTKICGLKNQGEVPLYKFYNFMIGLQKYVPQGKEAFRDFNPVFVKDRPDFSIMTTADQLKGYVLFQPPMWNQVQTWEFMNQYLNSMVNEMYTVLKCDQYNRIRLTLVAREQPFGTGLYDAIDGPLVAQMKMDQEIQKKEEQRSKLNKSGKNKSSKIKVTPPKVSTVDPPAQRAMYGNLPRWVIDESMILSLSYTSSEANRTNFVQVFSANVLNAYAGGPKKATGTALGKITSNPEAFKLSQFQQNNFISDNNDIARNGLKMKIMETNYGDVIDPWKTSRLWTRMKADHLFNGQLKPRGQVSLPGIQVPIVEGDNIEIRGIVFHIDSVHHQATIAANGRKTFRTDISFSNGIMAHSLETDKQIPIYPPLAKNPNIDEQAPFIPGLTDEENR